MSKDDDYGLSPKKEESSFLHQGRLPSKKPKAYKPKIGLIGTGGISEFHLRNYQSCGFEVAAFQSHPFHGGE